MSVDTAQVKEMLQNSSVVFLDVRRQDELDQDGKLAAKNFIHIPHTEVQSKFSKDDAEFEVNATILRIFFRIFLRIF